MQCNHSQMLLRSSTPGSTIQILSQKPCKQNKQSAYPHQIWENIGMINRSLKPEERSRELFIASPLPPNTIYIHTYVDTHTYMYTHTQEACCALVTQTLTLRPICSFHTPQKDWLDWLFTVGCKGRSQLLIKQKSFQRRGK